MEYLIFEDRHYSVPLQFKPKINCTRVDFTFKFRKNCWYNYINTDSNDINKLYGISYGVLGPHKNSFRIGWIPDFNNNGKIKIYYYGYENTKTHISKYLMTVDVEKEYNIDMFLHGKLNEPLKLCIELNGCVVLYDEPCKIKSSWLGFICKPYFGGDNISPKKMIIEIN